MTENALSILIVIFSVQLQQTEISERKLFIFHLGRCAVCYCWMAYLALIVVYLPEITYVLTQMIIISGD